MQTTSNTSQNQRAFTVEELAQHLLQLLSPEED